MPQEVIACAELIVAKALIGIINHGVFMELCHMSKGLQKVSHQASRKAEKTCVPASQLGFWPKIAPVVVVPPNCRKVHVHIVVA
mmetsp:Transcript_27689/g.90181  ORF Transcript_27689/g.90181 Transcript_27689/m.90181 type:complete len:84 (+) Transcript_27689:554-805(+)